MSHWSESFPSEAGPPLVLGTPLSQRSFPDATSRHMTSRFAMSPPDRKTRSPQTTGELKPPAGTSTLQPMFSPVFTSHEIGKPPCALTPLPLGPRKRGQLAWYSSGVAQSAARIGREPARRDNPTARLNGARKLVGAFMDEGKRCKLGVPCA